MRTDFKVGFAYLFFLLFSVTTGCTVRYVAEYDAAIKEEIVQVSKKVDLFWGELLGTPVKERNYAKFKDKYNEIETDIRGLVMKNEIRSFNKESTKQAKIALALWIEDKELHKKDDSFTDFEASQHRNQFMRVFTAMAKGEEVKYSSPQ
jgi:hypothetical protein